ncbi:MAG: hypothetical protein K1Y36_21050 [Blastocatellia bacterium]|nr:hypothetical protein [Blastocatellia bacterium]
MQELKLSLVVRHSRVLPKLFLLLERLGADCIDMQGTLLPRAGGTLNLTLACSERIEHRVRPQIARLMDVIALHDTPETALEDASFETTSYRENLAGRAAQYEF